MIDLTITLTRTTTAVVEFVVEFADKRLLPFGEDEFLPTDANVVYSRTGDFRYAQVHGWRVLPGNNYAGRRRLEASESSLAGSDPFVQQLVEQLRPLVSEVLA